MLVIQPRMIRISPRISTLPPPPGPTFTRNESRRWADRTLLARTPRCQPNLAATSAFPTATLRATARPGPGPKTRSARMRPPSATRRDLPGPVRWGGWWSASRAASECGYELTCEAMRCRLVCWGTRSRSVDSCAGVAAVHGLPDGQPAVAGGRLLVAACCGASPSSVGRPAGRARARHRAALEEFAAGTRSRPCEVPEARWGDDAGVS